MCGREKERELGQGTEICQGSESEQEEEPVAASQRRGVTWHVQYGRPLPGQCRASLPSSELVPSREKSGAYGN